MLLTFLRNLLLPSKLGHTFLFNQVASVLDILDRELVQGVGNYIIRSVETVVSYSLLYAIWLSS